MGELLEFRAVTHRRSKPAHRIQLQRYADLAQDAVDEWCAAERLKATGAEFHSELDQAQRSISQAISSVLETSGRAQPIWPVFVHKPHFKHASRCAFYAFKRLLPIFGRQYKDPLLAAYAHPILNDRAPTMPKFAADIDAFLSVFDYVLDMSDEIRRQSDRARFH